MFTPRSNASRSASSSFTATPQSARSIQTRRVANVFTQQRKASPFTGKGAGNRSTLQQSQLLEESHNFRVERFGTPLPVLITEALTYADGNTRITVKTEPSGWAWLVGGRKLFVWRYKHSSTARNVLCKELTLPPSDLAHSAARVCVVPSSGDSQSSSCIAVSPEGIVRYWPNIAYEGASVEISAELKGEECDSVINMAPHGCLLATTTSSLILLTTVPGQNSITCRSLTAAQGMFAGIGRRMSSLIFGGGPGQATGAALQAVIPGQMDEDECSFYVLSGTHLQKWMQNFGTEKFLYQIDADRLFREKLAKQVWDQDSVHLTQLTTWILDIQVTRDGVLMLGAGLNLDAQPLVHYALASIVTEVSGTPNSLQSFCVLDYVRPYKEEYEAALLSFKLLYPEVKGEEMYMYNDNTIIMSTVNGGPPNEIKAPGGRLLGAGASDSCAVFFSISQGLFSITSTQKQDISILDETTQEMIARGEVSQLMTSTVQLEELSHSEDKSARMKAAFLMACSGNMSQAQEIIEELFPDPVSAQGTGSSELDRLVTGLSKDLIDDIPASDPRWAESVRPDSTNSTTSLIILQQIKDKQVAHDYILSFLKKLNLWDKLRTVMAGENLMSTRLLLCEHAEKLEAAILLREMHSEYSQVIDPAIRKVLSYRGDHTAPGLTPWDFFYREVSQVHQVFAAMVEFENDIMTGDYPPADVAQVLSSVNIVMEGMLHAALQYRKSKADMYQADSSPGPESEYIPWTSTEGNHCLRTLVFKQFQLTLDVAVPEVRDIESKGQLFQQLLSLADNILDGYSSQIASLLALDNAERLTQVEEKYVLERRNLIMPFLEHKQYERAASLAEKYLDFEILIRLCEETENKDRIQRYQEQFADKGFADFLFDWYMKEGKRGRLLSLPVTQQTQLQSFLQKDELGYLKWLHDVECGDFKSAHETLLQLGRNEVNFLAKKKTLLSLSKLSALACEDETEEMEENIRGIDEEQQLILHQELLPADLIESMQLDPEHMKVLNPAELIQLYISNENSSATEYDFKKALDLLQFLVRDDTYVDVEDIRIAIWCRALLRDQAVWLHPSSGDPIDSVKDTIFFKTILVCASEGLEPHAFLPNLQSLLDAEELMDLRLDKQLQFLLGAVYERATTG